MFFLTYGDTGPRVVLVQTLLRLRGIEVRINGVWDSSCMRSIERFRARLKRPPMGPVDGRVFFQLIQGTKLKVIDSMDASAGPLTTVAKADFKWAGIEVLLNERKPGQGVARAVDRIVERSKNHRICLLRLIGHGNGGNWICVALGDPVMLRKSGRMEEYEELKADWQSYIDYSHYERHRPNLERITPLFAKFGSAEVHSCTVGSKQQELIQKMADTWGVPVTAGLGVQYIGASKVNRWGEYVPSTFSMEGDVFTAYPGKATLQSWANSIESAIPDLARLINNMKQKLNR